MLLSASFTGNGLNLAGCWLVILGLILVFGGQGWDVGWGLVWLGNKVILLQRVIFAVLACRVENVSVRDAYFFILQNNLLLIFFNCGDFGWTHVPFHRRLPFSKVLNYLVDLALHLSDLLI